MERRLPTKFLLQFGGVECLSQVVAGTVRNVGDEVQVFAFGSAEKPVNGIDDDLDQVDVLPFVEPTYIVGFGN